MKVTFRSISGKGLDRICSEGANLKSALPSKGRTHSVLKEKIAPSAASLIFKSLCHSHFRAFVPGGSVSLDVA